MRKLMPALLLAPVLAWAVPVKVIFDTDMLTDRDMGIGRSANGR